MRVLLKILLLVTVFQTLQRHGFQFTHGMSKVKINYGEKKQIQLPLSQSTSEQAEVTILVYETVGKLFQYDGASKICSTRQIYRLTEKVMKRRNEHFYRVCYQAPDVNPNKPILHDRIVYQEFGNTEVFNLTLELPKLVACSSSSCEVHVNEDEEAIFALPYSGGWPGIQPLFTILNRPQNGDLFEVTTDGKLTEARLNVPLTRNTLAYRPFENYFNVGANGSRYNLLGQNLNGCQQTKPCPDTLEYAVYYKHEGNNDMLSNTSVILLWVHGVIEENIQINTPKQITGNLFQTLKFRERDNSYEYIQNLDQDMYTLQLHLEPKFVALRLQTGGQSFVNSELQLKLSDLFEVHRGHDCIFQNCLQTVEIKGSTTALNQLIETLEITLYEIPPKRVSKVLTLWLSYGNTTYDKAEVWMNISQQTDFIRGDDHVFSLLFVITPTLGTMASIFGLLMLSETNQKIRDKTRNKRWGSDDRNDIFRL